MIMKKAVVVMFLLALCASFTSLAVGQATQEDARRAFEAASSGIQPANRGLSAPSMRTMSATSGHAIPGPGEERLVYLYASRQYADPGDEIRIKMFAVTTDRSPVYIYGQISYPGRSGRYDETGRLGYFYAGSFAGGLQSVYEVDLYSIKLPADAVPGEYVVDFIISEPSSGRLRQQVRTRFVVGRGPDVESYFRVEEAQTFFSSRDGGTIVVLRGRFLVGVPYENWIITPGLGAVSNGPAISYDGQTLQILRPGAYDFHYRTFDLVIQDQTQFREAITIRDLRSRPAPFPTPTPIP